MSTPGIVGRFADAVTRKLGRQLGPDENFFDAGLDSVTLEALHGQVTVGAAGRYPITDLFAHPNLRALARRWSDSAHRDDSARRDDSTHRDDGGDATPAVTRQPRRASAGAGQLGRRRRELRSGGDGS